MIRLLIERAPRLTLVLFCLAAWMPGLFALPPGDRDESRFAQATRQMIGTGDAVRIMNGAEPRNRKPIGIHWLQVPFVIAAHAAGLATENPIWPYRLPSIAGGIAAVLATFELGLVLTGRRQVGLLAGAMLGGCVILAVETHIAKTDAALLGATTIAMAMLARAWMGVALRRRHAALFWLAAGAAILLKGPVAPMVLALAVLALGLSFRRWRWLLALRPAWGVPLLLVVVLPWFVAIEIATHGAFVTQAVGGDLGHKLTGGAETHGGFPGLHLLLLPLLAFPSSALVLAALPDGWVLRRDKATGFLLAWLLPGWLVFEAIPTRLPHYPLPLYPAAFLLAAAWVSRPYCLGAGRFPRAAQLVAAAAFAAAALALPLYLHAPWWLGLPAAAACGLAATAAWSRRPLLALTAAIPLYAAILRLELPALDALWLAPRVKTALLRDWPQWNAEATGLAVAGYAEPSLMFATGADLRLLPDGRSGADALVAGLASLVIVEGRDLPGFSEEAARRRLAPRLIERIDGFDYSNGRWTSLSLYRK